MKFQEVYNSIADFGANAAEGEKFIPTPAQAYLMGFQLALECTGNDDGTYTDLLFKMEVPKRLI
jgi:hypothetical protein